MPGRVAAGPHAGQPRSAAMAVRAWLDGSGPSGRSTTVPAPAARSSATLPAIVPGGPIRANSRSGSMPSHAA